MTNKRLVFTVTPGRSGTGYLSEMLRLLPGVSAYHEPNPLFSNFLRATLKNTETGKNFLMNKKLPVIFKSHGNIYVETSHLFCKGFLEPLLELGYIPDLIILKREHRKVALSLYQLGTIPHENTPWLLYPGDKGVLQIDDWKKLSDYQLCFWYCLEIERRAKEYSKLIKAKEGLVGEIFLEDIKDENKFQKFLSDMMFPTLKGDILIKYKNNRERKVNTKVNKKKTDINIPKNIEEQEKYVLDNIKEVND